VAGGPAGYTDKRKLKMFNITDPRVFKRAKRALEFTLAQIPANNPKPISTRLIDQHYGQSQHNLSKQLRELLLITHDSHYNMLTGKCKQYTRNTEGCKSLLHLLDPTVEYSAAEEQHITAYVSRFDEELLTGKFEYNDKSNRHWHPLQNLPSDIRKRELAKYGYKHIYDIRCAAPSIILHLAQDLGIKLKHTSTIEHYIANKTAIRQELAHDLQLSISDVKRLITMLFNRAPIGHVSSLATTQLLRGDSRTIETVKANAYIKSLREEIKHCWDKLAKYQIEGEYAIPRTYHSDGRKKRITSSDRWQLYFLYERHVMNSVTAYLDKQLALYLIEHDGWSSNIQIDLNDLTHHVRTSTGINTIEFEYECY
jgi:hypothetical protein